MQTLQEYVSSLTPAQKTEYERVKKIVHSVVPEGVEEMISYGIPTFKYNGTHLLYFGAFKNHMSLFPGAGLIEDLKADFEGYKVAKGTVQFTHDKPLSDDLIKKILALRLEMINQKTK